MNVFPKKVLNFEHKNTANSGILYVCCLRDSCRIQSGARSATDCSGGRDPLEVPPHHGGIGRPLAAKKLTRFYLLPPRGLRRNLEMLASQTLPLRGTLPPSEGGGVLCLCILHFWGAHLLRGWSHRWSVGLPVFASQTMPLRGTLPPSGVLRCFCSYEIF